MDAQVKKGLGKWWFMAALVFLVGVLGVTKICIGKAMVSHRYFVAAGVSPFARRKLSEDLGRELEVLSKDAKRYGATANAYDLDMEVPLDRVQIVLAIEQYQIKKGRLPKSFQALLDEGLLKESDLTRTDYSLKYEKGVWNLWAAYRTDKPVAVGN
jgi:hypothetical protein